MNRPKHTPNVLDPFSGTYASVDDRREHAAGLRALADWLEQTTFPVPSLALKRNNFSGTIDIPSVWIDDESFIRRPGSAARLIGGRVDKGTAQYGTDFHLSRDFGGGVNLLYRISREAVCEAKQVVVHEDHFVPEDEEAARSLQFHIDELKGELAEMPTVVRSVPVTITDYVCPDSLLVKESAT